MIDSSITESLITLSAIIAALALMATISFSQRNKRRTKNNIGWHMLNSLTALVELVLIYSMCDTIAKLLS